MNEFAQSYCRVFSEERLAEFVAKGYLKSHCFPHSVFYLPKCGPDGMKLAQRMIGQNDPNKLWEVVLYAISPVLDEFPSELFFDKELIWHQQQFGRNGQIATANLVVDGNSLYTMVHISDLVQRISRRKEYKTRIENRFKGWHHLLLNSILNFALENDLRKVFSPTAEFALRHTDPKRKPQRELFARVYDRAVHHRYDAVKNGNWWMIGVDENIANIVIPVRKEERTKRAKTICVCHDIEGGLGHTNVDRSFAGRAHEASSRYLDIMLSIEQEFSITATYNIVGCLMNDVREKVEKGGHTVTFHSYDHAGGRDQLGSCRQVDYRIKGYRPSGSRITHDLSDVELCYHNFEWLISSAYSLGMKRPRMENRIVKLPILFDDFAMYEENIAYQEWEQRAVRQIKENDFVAFSLHDCYATYWLPHYKRFLGKIRTLGEFRTMDQVANDVILGSAV